MKRGFMYLVAILDWYSRYILSWKISNTLDGSFCLTALKEALENYDKPEIFNTDQGSQFTANSFTYHLKDANIKVSMDGRGLSVKHENIYLNDYETGIELITGLRSYFNFYNHQRFHQSLDYQTPSQLYQFIR